MMGYFDSMPASQQQAALMALTQMGGTIMANADQPGGVAFGRGVNAGLAQYNQGLSMARQQEQQDSLEQYRKATLDQREQLAAAGILHDIQRDKTKHTRAMDLAAYMSPLDKAREEEALQRAKWVIAKISGLGEDDDEGLVALADALRDGKKTPVDEEDSGPGMLDSLMNYLMRLGAPTTQASPRPGGVPGFQGIVKDYGSQ